MVVVVVVMLSIGFVTIGVMVFINGISCITTTTSYLILTCFGFPLG